MGVDPEQIYGEQGAIVMDAVVVPTDHMQFVVECASFQPPHMSFDDVGPIVDMTEVSAPNDETAGLYRDTVTFASIGPHTINCFNGITSADEKVFAGNYPLYDPDKYKKNELQVIANERAIAAKISRTTGTLNG